MMDSCIDQLIVYMIRQGFLKTDSVPNSKQKINLIYTFNGAKFDHKFLHARLLKFVNISSFQGDSKQMK